MKFASQVRVSGVGDREGESYISPPVQREAIASYAGDTVRQNLYKITAVSEPQPEVSEQQSAQIRGDARRAISRSVVSLLKEHLGRGPVKAKTHINEDSVLVLMYDGHTVSEKTLGGDGQPKAVASQRVKSSEAIHDLLTAVVEAETNRKVVGFMTSSQQEPSLLSFVFVLDSTDLLAKD